MGGQALDGQQSPWACTGARFKAEAMPLIRQMADTPESAQAACRIYSVPQTTQQDALDAAAGAMAAGGVSTYSIALNPPTKAEIDVAMEQVSVTITVAFDSNSAGSWFFDGKMLTGQAVLPAEY